MCSGGRGPVSASCVVWVALGVTEVVVMAEHGRYNGPWFAQLDDNKNVWAVFCRAQLIKEKVWAAIVTDRAAEAADGKGDAKGQARDEMNVMALATIEMSVKPVHRPTVMALATAKGAWDALKDMFVAHDNARLQQLMHELRSLKKGGDENIIKYTSRATSIRQDLSMLDNQVDETTLVLHILSELPRE